MNSKTQLDKISCLSAFYNSREGNLESRCTGYLKAINVVFCTVQAAYGVDQGQIPITPVLDGRGRSVARPRAVFIASLQQWETSAIRP